MENKNNSYQEKVFDTLIQVAVEDILIQNEQELAEVETPESFEPSDQFLEWEKRFLASARRGERESRREARKKGGFHFNSALRRAAAIVLTVLVIGGGTVVSVDAFNPDFFKSIFKWGENYSTLVSTEKNKYPDNIVPEGWDFVFVPKLLPVNFKLREIETLKNKSVLKYRFTTEDNSQLTMNQCRVKYDSLIVDTEKASNKEIIIGNVKGYAINKDGMNAITWVQDGIQIYLMSYSVNSDELIEIAGSVEKITEK